MSRIVGFAGLAFALTLLPAGDALAQKKKGAKDDTARAAPEDYAKFHGVKQFAGELVSIDGGSKIIAVKIDFPEYARNPNYRPPRGGTNNQAGQLQRLMIQYQQAMANPNPRTRMQQIQRVTQQIQRAEMNLMRNAARGSGGGNNSPVKLIHHDKTFELIMQENVVLRKMMLGSNTFDDQGNIKEFTKAEIAKLKGTDSTKPGYAAKVEEFLPGSVVMLYLTPAKSDSKKSDAKDGEVDSSDRPTVRMVVMTKEGSLSFGDRPAPKKK
jgi:hypothetical protein